jgi:hypothetical protein
MSNKKMEKMHFRLFLCWAILHLTISAGKLTTIIAGTRFYVAPHAYIEEININTTNSNVSLPIRIEENVSDEVQQRILKSHRNMCRHLNNICQVLPLLVTQVRVNYKPKTVVPLNYSVDTEWQDVTPSGSSPHIRLTGCSTCNLTWIIKSFQLEFPRWQRTEKTIISLTLDELLCHSKMNLMGLVSSWRMEHSLYKDPMEKNRQDWQEKVYKWIEKHHLRDNGLVLASKSEEKRLKENIMEAISSDRTFRQMGAVFHRFSPGHISGNKWIALNVTLAVFSRKDLGIVPFQLSH